MAVKPLPISQARKNSDTLSPESANDVDLRSADTSVAGDDTTDADADKPKGFGPDALKADPRKLAVLAIAAAALLFLGNEAVNWLSYGRFAQVTDNAYVRADITPIAARVQGYVNTVHVSDNQTVKAGDLLVTLEADDYAARVAEAEAALLQAQANAAQLRARAASTNAALASVQSQITAQRDRVSEARAGISSAEADARQASDDLKRYRELAQDGFYPEARLAAAETAQEAADAALTRSRAAAATQRSVLNVTETAVDGAEQEIAAANAAVASAEAGILAAQARLDAAKLDLERTRIRAPIDGIVANRVARQGQLLSPGQQTLAIVPLDEAYVIANFKETQVRKMTPGQVVRLEIDAYPDLEIEGHVDSLAPASGAQFSLLPQDTATGNFTKIVQRVPVRISLSEEALATGLMRPGLSVEASVDTRQTD